MIESVLHALKNVGFGDLESRVYVALLEHGPQSGYGVAKRIAKAGANTYTAIEALERKGAVLREDGTPRIFRAVPVDEMLAALGSAFSRQAERAREELEGLAVEAPDAGTYRLREAHQVVERARMMLRQAKAVAIVDAFPNGLATIEGEIAVAMLRGVTIIIKAYAPTTIPATRVIMYPQGASVIERSAGDWFNVSVDGREVLIAFLESGMSSVRDAVWTQSRTVAWTMHCGIACEVTVAALGEAAAANPERPLATALADAHDLLYLQARGYMDIEG